MVVDKGRGFRTGAPALVALLCASALWACGGGSSGSVGKRTANVSPTPPSSGCGSFSAKPPKDPDGVLAALSAEQRQTLGGYPSVRRSEWADWKPSHAPPYTVGIVMAGAIDELQVDVLKTLRTSLGKSKLVREVLVMTTGNNLDIPQQLQQFSAMLRRKPDLIITEPLQPEAFTAGIERAGRAGIPVVTFLGDVASPYALNVNANAYQNAALTSSVAARMLSGKGRVLYVHGYPSTSVDRLSFQATKDVLAHCPDMKLAGEATGLFLDSTAKAETLKFLATHPAGVDVVQQTGGMAPGVMRAFESTGRAMPIVSDIAAEPPSLGYWRQHREQYAGVGVGQGPAALGSAVVGVALRTLEGRGPKLNAIIGKPALITDRSLDDWAQESWTLSSAGVAQGPAGAFLPDDELDGLFSR